MCKVSSSSSAPPARETRRPEGRPERGATREKSEAAGGPQRGRDRTELSEGSHERIGEVVSEIVRGIQDAFADIFGGGDEDPEREPGRGPRGGQEPSSEPRAGQGSRPGTGQAGGAQKGSAVGQPLSQEDQELAARVDKYLDQAADQGAGKAIGPDGKPNPGLRGQGELIVSLSRQYDIPVELMMAQLQKESGFLSDPNNLSIANNNPGNLRFADWEAREPFNGKPDGPGNFTTFPSIEQGLTAYADLLRNVYGDYIDRGDWQGMVNKYAPPSENDSNLYAQQLVDWQADWRQKLGIS
ncbi:MAG: glucosaminidase domain-containing protein [Candidatus Eremiobacteraeota bacterium]|nr:glucosaminidase domain-containing protein [Candidatus Eremiobacteraeota bacterium]MCW5870619.1 glucosaminidase domain-containing protein [Candidatus Eremiobacteraeota bacterium]